MTYGSVKGSVRCTTVSAYNLSIIRSGRLSMRAIRPRRLVFAWMSAGTDHRLSLVAVLYFGRQRRANTRVDHTSVDRLDGR
jgi:hypothetical protein